MERKRRAAKLTVLSLTSRSIYAWFYAWSVGRNSNFRAFTKLLNNIRLSTSKRLYLRPAHARFTRSQDFFVLEHVVISAVVLTNQAR